MCSVNLKGSLVLEYEDTIDIHKFRTRLVHTTYVDNLLAFYRCSTPPTPMYSHDLPFFWYHSHIFNLCDLYFRTPIIMKIPQLPQANPLLKTILLLVTVS